MRWKRWIPILLLLAAVVALVVYGFRPRPLLVDAARAARDSILVTVEEEGKTRVRDRYIVSAPVAGYLRRHRWDVGDPVAREQPLFTLEPLRAAVLDPRSRAESEARLAAAEASHRAARERARAAAADFAYWETQLARVRALFESGDVAKEVYDRALSESRRAEAVRRSADQDVEAARAGVESARASLRYSAAVPANPADELVRVRAPAAGRILKVIRKSEGVVNAAEAVLDVANSRALEVEVEVLSADAVRISPLTRVLFRHWGGEAPLEGRVRRIEPVAFTKISALGVEEQRVLVIVDITSPEPLWRRLGDAYRVEASFVLAEADAVLTVPASALFRYQDQWAVFLIDAENAARRRVVELGLRNGFLAEVRSGLAEGDVVITHPDDAVEDGKLVQARFSQ